MGVIRHRAILASSIGLTVTISAACDRKPDDLICGTTPPYESRNYEKWRADQIAAQCPDYQRWKREKDAAKSKSDR